MPEQFTFDDEFQDSIISHFIASPDKFLCYGDVLQPSFFQGAQSTVTAHALLDYVRKYGKSPSWTTLRQLAIDQNKKLALAEDAEVIQYIDKLRDLDADDTEYVVSKVISFARERATVNAIKKSIELIRDNKTPDDGFVKLFQDALQVGQNLDDLGYVFHVDYEAIIKKVTNEDYGTPTGYRQWDTIWRRGWGPGWLVVILAPPKSYKCLSPNTLVMMHNGSIRQAKDVSVGDKLMGDDSTPRNVTHAGYGKGPMYRVTCLNDGSSYVCNDAHILCLKSEDGRDLEIEAKDFYALCQKTPTMGTRYWQGFKVGVEFLEKEVPLDPYWLGLWLGDGSSRHAGIAVGDRDPEIREFIYQYAKTLGLLVSECRSTGCSDVRICAYKRGPDHKSKFKWKSNPIMEKMRDLNLIKNKHVPNTYKINSRKLRMELLAGLIDSDGYADPDSGFKFVNMNKTLIDDVHWLALSLGFNSRIIEFKTGIKRTGFVGSAMAVVIAGNVESVPTRLPRKKLKNSKKHRFLNHKIKIEPIGDGDYYGFAIDGNHRFLLGDFTVTHNTGLCVNLALNVISPMVGGDVLYYPCEITSELAFARALTNITQKPLRYLYNSPEKFSEAAKEAMVRSAAGTLVIKGYPAGTTTLATIRNHARMAKQQYKLKNLRAIIIDYADTVLPSGTFEKSYLSQAAVYTEARAIGAEFGCPVIMPDRMTKEATDQRVPSMKAFQGAFAKGGIVDVAIGICMTDAERAQNILRTFVFVNRHGPVFQHFRGKVDPETMLIDLGEEIPYDPDESDNEFTRKKSSRGMPAELAGG